MVLVWFYAFYPWHSLVSETDSALHLATSPYIWLCLCISWAHPSHPSPCFCDALAFGYLTALTNTPFHDEKLRVAVERHSNLAPYLARVAAAAGQAQSPVQQQA